MFLVSTLSIFILCQKGKCKTMNVNKVNGNMSEIVYKCYKIYYN